MADVTLSYKGSDILELSDSGSATLKTGGKYCEDDIAVEYVKPSDGGSRAVEYITAKEYNYAVRLQDDIAVATGFESFVVYTTEPHTTGYQFVGLAWIVQPNGDGTGQGTTYRWTSANAYGYLGGLQSITVSPPIGTKFIVVNAGV